MLASVYNREIDNFRTQKNSQPLLCNNEYIIISRQLGEYNIMFCFSADITAKTGLLLKTLSYKSQ